MKLRDLFQRWASTGWAGKATAPVTGGARRPDWPTMPAMQRAVGAPELITAPEEFTGSLASWRNPSRSGTLGHYLTPDAPAGIGDGLATVPRPPGLPAPARPWWWPRPPAVQRRVPTSAPTAELDSSLLPDSTAEPISTANPDLATDPGPATEPGPAEGFVELVGTRPPTPTSAVPARPLRVDSLVSAAGAEPPVPRFALPAVQRTLEDPAPIPNRSLTATGLPIVESPPEVPLPPVVEPGVEPTPAVSAGSPLTPSPSGPPDPPVSRRLGLGAPLQRIPDAGNTPPAVHTKPLHQVPDPQVELDSRAPDVAPLVSGSPPIATPVTSESPTPVTAASLPVQRSISAPPPRASQPPPRQMAAPASRPAGPTSEDGEPSTSQRAFDTDAAITAEFTAPAAPTGPMDLAPLVSESSPMGSLATSPTAADPPLIPATVVPPGVPSGGGTEEVTAAAEPSSDMDHALASHTPTGDRAIPELAGLLGERHLEPVISSLSASVPAAAAPVPAATIPALGTGPPAAVRALRPVAQRQAASVSAPGVAARPWPLQAHPVGGSSPGVDEPAPPTPPAVLTAAGPIAIPELTTTLVVQRAEAAGAPTDPTAPATATSPGATAPPTGSSSPTEVDTLVRRLYDPIVRRLKAELQLDRERAGHSLDLRH